MTWTFEVTDKRRDASNFNIVATIKYTDGATVINEDFAGVDITDATIAEQARKRIRNVLEIGDAALAAITTGKGTIPDAPATDAKQQAILDASRELHIAAQKAQLVKLDDAAVNAALAKLEAAQAA